MSYEDDFDDNYPVKLIIAYTITVIVGAALCIVWAIYRDGETQVVSVNRDIVTVCR